MVGFSYRRVRASNLASKLAVTKPNVANNDGIYCLCGTWPCACPEGTEGVRWNACATNTQTDPQTPTHAVPVLPEATLQPVQPVLPTSPESQDSQVSTDTQLYCAQGPVSTHTGMPVGTHVAMDAVPDVPAEMELVPDVPAEMELVPDEPAAMDVVPGALLADRRLVLANLANLADLVDLVGPFAPAPVNDTTLTEAPAITEPAIPAKIEDPPRTLFYYVLTHLHLTGNGQINLEELRKRFRNYPAILDFLEKLLALFAAGVNTADLCRQLSSSVKELELLDIVGNCADPGHTRVYSPLDLQVFAVVVILRLPWYNGWHAVGLFKCKRRAAIPPAPPGDNATPAEYSVYICQLVQHIYVQITHGCKYDTSTKEYSDYIAFLLRFIIKGVLLFDTPCINKITRVANRMHDRLTTCRPKNINTAIQSTTQDVNALDTYIAPPFDSGTDPRIVAKVLHTLALNLAALYKLIHVKKSNRPITCK